MEKTISEDNNDKLLKATIREVVESIRKTKFNQGFSQNAINNKISEIVETNLKKFKTDDT